MGTVRTRRRGRIVRHARVRRKVRGTSERPRLAVFRSLKHVYAQIIDDTQGVTLAAASSLEREIRAQKDGNPKTEVSGLVGALLAKRAKDKRITAVVFDRGGYKFHGRVKKFAETARSEGLVF